MVREYCWTDRVVTLLDVGWRLAASRCRSCTVLWTNEARALSRTFHNEPQIKYLFPDEEMRRTILRWLFRFIVRSSPVSGVTREHRGRCCLDQSRGYVHSRTSSPNWYLDDSLQIGMVYLQALHQSLNATADRS